LVRSGAGARRGLAKETKLTGRGPQNGLSCFIRIDQEEKNLAVEAHTKSGGWGEALGAPRAREKPEHRSRGKTMAGITPSHAVKGGGGGAVRG